MGNRSIPITFEHEFCRRMWPGTGRRRWAKFIAHNVDRNELVFLDFSGDWPRRIAVPWDGVSPWGECVTTEDRMRYLRQLAARVDAELTPPHRRPYDPYKRRDSFPLSCWIRSGRGWF